MAHLYFDTETYSEVDLKSAGTPRYAESPTTEITIAQWAVDDGEVVVEDLTGRQPPSAALQSLLADDEVTLVIHNSAFDRAVCRHVWGIELPTERIQDTMVIAMLHGLPGGLDKLGQILGLPQDQQKDRRGAQLIQLFCKPRPKNHKLRRATPETHPSEWAEFLEYARQDIVTMRALHARLPSGNTALEHSLWCLDQRINDRGFLVDTELAEAAVKASRRAKANLASRVQELTDDEVRSATQRDQLLQFVLKEYQIEDLRASTIRTALESGDMPPDVRELLDIRLKAGRNTVGKYQALLRAVSSDGRLRNTLQFSGATRTARWSGRVFQPQNLMRPNMKAPEIEQAIEMLKHGAEQWLYPDTTNVIGNAVRGSIVAAPGKKLCIADLANIEGRGLAWLADEEWKLQAFRDYDAGIGSDLYQVAYARSFGIKPADATGEKRQIGKTMELALGYAGGVNAFLTFAAVYRTDLNAMATNVLATADETTIRDARSMMEWAKKQDRLLGLAEDTYVACEILKSNWRKAHAATVQFWQDCQDGFEAALYMPGVVHTVGRHVKSRRDGRWLKLRLPSGRMLYYMDPQIDNGQLSYMGVNQFTRQWTRVKTYSGKIAENLTQAFARDVLAYNMQPIENAGYPIVLSVHDELLTETPDTDEYSWQHLAEMMSTVPPWAEGLPLAAAGFETRRYRKE